MEMEIGVVGGEEDGVIGEINEKLYTTPEDALLVADALGTGENGRYMLAATFGNVHGVYKPGHVKLRPSVLKQIQDAVGAKVGKDKPFDLVFHGGCGSSLEEIRETLDYGVVKMNIDTDTQYAFTRPAAGHMFSNYDGVLKVDGNVGSKKAYDPRSLWQGGRGRHVSAGGRGLRGPALDRHDAGEVTAARADDLGNSLRHDVPVSCRMARSRAVRATSGGKGAPLARHRPAADPSQPRLVPDRPAPRSRPAARGRRQRRPRRHVQHHRPVDAGEYTVQSPRPVQRIGVAEHRRGAFLDQVAGEQHAGCRDRHDDIAVGVAESVMSNDNRSAADVEFDGIVDQRVRRCYLHRLDRGSERLAVGLGSRLRSDPHPVGRAVFPQARGAATVTPDGRRTERRIAERVVEMRVRVDDYPRVACEVPDGVDEVARLTIVAAGVDDEAGALADDESAVEVERHVSSDVHLIPDLVPICHGRTIGRPPVVPRRTQVAVAPPWARPPSRGRLAVVMHHDLLAGPPPTLLPDDPDASAMLDGGAEPASVAAAHPAYPAAWAALADDAYARNAMVESYAYARTGYHRSLDQLRRAGWKGSGPVPGNMHPIEGSFAPCTRSVARPPPSTRTTRRSDVRLSCATAVRKRISPCAEGERSPPLRGSGHFHTGDRCLLPINAIVRAGWKSTREETTRGRSRW